uniref:Transmembrane protein 194A n=1 Tax=Steinernema glaseri TaxID=37863 RepID=A0A1I8AWA8_9BILA
MGNHYHKSKHPQVEPVSSSPSCLSQLGRLASHTSGILSFSVPMAPQQKPSLWKRLDYLQIASLLAAVFSIFSGTMCALLFQMEAVPYYYRLFYVIHGAILVLTSLIMIYGVLSEKPKYLFPFLFYQIYTVIMSIVATIYTLIKEIDFNAFVVNMHLRWKLWKPEEEFSPDLHIPMFVFTLIYLFLIPLVASFVVYFCYDELEWRLKNRNKIVLPAPYRFR